MVQSYAERTNQSVLCVDIGGATTDVFSVFPDREGVPVFNRTVSANLGMSYSVANVLVEAGATHIRHWLPFELPESELRDRLRNKMIRPTSIPQTVEDLYLEQAVCREALRLSLKHHRSLAIGFEGKRERSIADVFRQGSDRYELVDLIKLDVVIGSGGVLSHAPSRMQAALMMIDGFGLAGVTQLTVDSIFMMPHLGVFASVHSQAAQEIFENDCLIYLGSSVVPIVPVPGKLGDALAEVFLDGRSLGVVRLGEVHRLETPFVGSGTLRVVPLHKAANVGGGAGVPVEKVVRLGECGIIVDGRNRPFIASSFSVEEQKRVYHNLGLMR
jgi:hypothetical protein